ncbi:MAG: VapC toxin family PIN domain ribonuclease [Opitutaceae bacterium]|nr:VapC toxin family PIN domain ribonuclease [Opitutaceae bacterium]
MVAFDTNYLVRHIVQDDEEQCAIVASVLETETREDRSIRIFDLVLLETAWVLQAIYELNREAWVEILEELLADSAFVFDDPTRLRAVIKMYRKGKAEFADYFILETAHSESLELKTFDKKLLEESQA